MILKFPSTKKAINANWLREWFIAARNAFEALQAWMDIYGKRQAVTEHRIAALELRIFDLENDHDEA